MGSGVYLSALLSERECECRTNTTNSAYYDYLIGILEECKYD